MEAIHAGEIKALFPSASIPWCRCRDADFTREALERLEFFGVIDFFLSETAQYADVVLAGSLQEEEEGVTCSAEGRVIHIQRAVDPPGNARRDSGIICDLARRLGKGKYFPFRDAARDLRRAARGLARRPSPITTASPTKRSTRRWGCSGLAQRWITQARRDLIEGGVSFYPRRQVPVSSEPSGARAAIPWMWSSLCF